MQVYCNSYQNSSKFFLDVDKITLISIWKGKEIRKGKTVLKKNKMRGISLPISRL